MTINIDRQRLANISDGDKEFERELLGAYIDDARDCLARIKAAIASANWGDLAIVAHQLKGASGNVGANTMQKLCAQLEREAFAQQEFGTYTLLLQELAAIAVQAQDW